jgi:hypothetical protein
LKTIFFYSKTRYAIVFLAKYISVEKELHRPGNSCQQEPLVIVGHREGVGRLETLPDPVDLRDRCYV